MDTYYILIRVICGIIIGFVIGLTGVGGGVLVIPTLTLLLKIPPTISVGTASLYSFLTKIYASYEHFKLKTIDLNISFYFLIGALPGNIITSIYINKYLSKHNSESEVVSQFQNNLKLFMAIILLIAAILLIYKIIKKSEPYKKRLKDIKTIKVRMIKILSGLIIGSVIGSTSVGGGVLIMPVLIMFFGLTADKTVGTSIFITVILVLFTSLIYGVSGQVDLPTSFFMAVGSIAGVFAGSRLSVRIPENLLKSIITLLVLFSAVLMMISYF